MKPNKKLYRNLDDTYLYLRINNKAIKHKVRLFVFHQGKNKNNHFINLKYQIIINGISENNSLNGNVNQLKQVINNLYKKEALLRPIICSDGDHSFLGMAKRLKFKHILDKWHLLYAKFFRIFNSLKKDYDNTPKEIKKQIYQELVRVS